MGKAINCCHNCDRRTLGCHSTCEEYITQKSAYDAKQADIRKQKERDVLVSGKKVKHVRVKDFHNKGK